MVVVANRLPITWSEGSGWTASAGGLVTALEDALVGDRIHWVGWSGSEEPAPEQWRNIRLRSVPLDADEVAGYYDGFANSCLWPIMHDGLRPARMDWDWWRHYETVNERFAAAAAEAAPPNADVWIHDYHLLLMPAMLRRRRPDLRIGYYHHIPFPPPVVFQRLPWRDQLIDGLLGADLVGFQIAADAEAFRATAADRGWTVRGRTVLGPDGRPSVVSHFPATIDPAPLEAVAAEPATIEAARALRDDIGAERKLLVGVDRLDYTKAITARLEAFGALLERRADLVDQVAFVQVAVPSRDAVAEYQAECAEVQRLVGEINGRFARMGSAVVHFRHGSMERRDLVALYRAADVMVVTPLRDGQNLVAKEFVASRIDELGALVLSEFAGAAQELGDAILVNPFDVAGMSAGYLQALEMPVTRQRLAMVRMRAAVRNWTASRWTATYLSTLRQAAAVSQGTAA